MMVGNKRFKKDTAMKKIMFLVFITAALTSCENSEWEFPDYENDAVYFAYQYPVRTVVLGEDLFDNRLDNEHKIEIYASWGGGYTNDHNVVIDFSVEPSLCDNLYFDNPEDRVLPMPSNYYSLGSNTIEIPKGEVAGGVEIQLTDAFFADELATGRNYVIPLQMNRVMNADSILRGKSDLENPNRNIATDWTVVPKDYVLYAVNYINTWDGNYLRRGIDEITKNGTTTTAVRHSAFVENDEVVSLNTVSLDELKYPISYANSLGINLNYKVDLTFDNDNSFAVSPVMAYQVNDSVRVYDIQAIGMGEFVKDGEKKSWGNKDRDALYMDYQTSFKVRTTFPNTTPARAEILDEYAYRTKDTLVARDRGVGKETFNVIVK